MANYINSKELLVEIIKSKEQDELTNKAAQMLLKMVLNVSKTMKYKDEEDRQDCQGYALIDIADRWRQFDANHAKANVFAYYTQVIKNGLAKGWKKLHKIRTIKMVPISKEFGIYNI